LLQELSKRDSSEILQLTSGVRKSSYLSIYFMFVEVC